MQGFKSFQTQKSVQRNFCAISRVLLVSLSLLFFQVSCQAQSKKKLIIQGDGDKVIEANSIIKSIEAGNDIVVSGCIINGKFNLVIESLIQEISNAESKVYINSAISFVNCTFNESIVANSKKEKSNINCHFQKAISFTNCIFKGEVTFKEASFASNSNFTACKFQKEANFEGCSFYDKYVQFTENNFLGEIKFQRARFLGSVTFNMSVFDGNLFFQNAIFMGNAQFLAAKFQKYTEFDGVSAHQMMLFNTSEFFGKFIFNYSSIMGRLEFKESKFLNYTEIKNVLAYGPVKFNGAKFGHTINMEDCQFILQKPDTEGLIKDDKCQLNIKNCFYQLQNPLQSANF